jgi:hypothetical protein
VNIRLHVERALAAVHGVDINPFAVAISHFRLVTASLVQCQISKLRDAPAWSVRVATGDSLRSDLVRGDNDSAYAYEYEDAHQFSEILHQRYHAVVGNPPYITVKDTLLADIYRGLWSACHRQYALSVPFAQRIFDLAVPGGFTGQITANSFMKREFGKKLIEEFFPSVDLNLVIDTSGAYIPGHGTPTVILAGRNRTAPTSRVRAVLGIRGEPTTPIDPAHGCVWSDIVHLVDQPGAETTFVSIVDLDRRALMSAPWTLSGGGASDLMSLLNGSSDRRLGQLVRLIGRTAHTGSDECYFAPIGTWRRAGVATSCVVPLVEGEQVRDYGLTLATEALFPYGPDLRASIDDIGASKFLWRYRSGLARRREPGGTHAEIGLTWYEWSRWHPERYVISLGIAMAFVATHNHFVMDRGGKVFKQSAPVIKLPEGAGEEEHLRLLGLLNSSTVCYWLKQVSQPKGGSGIGRGVQDEAWESRFEFTGTKLENLPVPFGWPQEWATRLDGLAARLRMLSPSGQCASALPTRNRLDVARESWLRTRADMVSAQEELDWAVYGLYGLLGPDADRLIEKEMDKPPLNLGERAFEIAMARKVAAGEEETEWFARHASTPVTDLPSDWPPGYRALVERRLTKMADDPYLHLIERPECKRRWASRSWEELEAEALRDWLLDRLETPGLWFHSDQPTVRTTAQLANELRADADFVSVADLYGKDTDPAEVVAALANDQQVPFLAQWRYTDAGLTIRQAWERTWDLQRAEDAGEDVGEIPVPPKYGKTDFREGASWSNRGKLDVPKERFISYPQVSRDGSLLLGWAGWDHLQQAQALAIYIAERRELENWGADQLTPLLAGLAELLPWVAQWHDEVHPDFGQRPAEAYAAFLNEQLLQLGLTRADLTAWRPPPAPTRGRRRSA